MLVVEGDVALMTWPGAVQPVSSFRLAGLRACLARRRHSWQVGKGRRLLFCCKAAVTMAELCRCRWPYFSVLSPAHPAHPHLHYPYHDGESARQCRHVCRQAS